MRNGLFFGLILAVVAAPVATPVAAQDFEFFPGASYDPAVPTLEQVAGHANGAKITSHAEAVAYLQALAGASPKVRLVQFGETWEGRSLNYLVITSEANHARVAEMQAGMQQLADPRGLSKSDADALISSVLPVTWLSYGVHGNEISSTDASLLTAYHLAASQNDEMVDTILANSIVIIDPMQNPDGRDRYVSHYRQTVGPMLDTDPAAAEHAEPWPSGRMNHYLFDMNRDWFALTQKESRARVKAFQEWWPVVFVDLHEMGANATYYFPPPAPPINPHYTKGQIDWLARFGQNNSKWFDRFRFDYYTGEVFDEFYPGYGTSWPMAHGTIGMTYEQASAEGRGIEREDETKLYYRDTVQHHFISSLSTAEVVARNREEMLRYFYDYRRTAIEEGQKESVKEYILPPGSDPGRAAKLAAQLQALGADVKQAVKAFTHPKVRRHPSGSLESREFPAGTYIIPLAQPAKRLLRTLLDPQVDMDKEFVEEQIRRQSKRLGDQIYDVTAWSLPLMQDVEFYIGESVTSSSLPVLGAPASVTGQVHGGPAHLAYVIRWGQHSAARALAGLLRQKVRVHFSVKEFTQNGVEFPRGSLIIKTKDNPSDLASRMDALAATYAVDIHATDRAWMDSGINFGSNNVLYLEPPRIALAWDRPTHPYSAGWVRYTLEQAYGLPVTIVTTERLARADLSRYNVIVLPSSISFFGGGYGGVFGERGVENLKTWIRQGGTLITLGAATQWLTGEKVGLLSTQRELRGGKPENTEDKQPSKSRDEGEGENAAEPSITPDRELPIPIPGAIMRVLLDPDHWLSAGYDGDTQVMVEGRNIYTPLNLDEGTNVARYAEAGKVLLSGFTYEGSREQLAGKAYLMVQNHGRGRVIAFAEDPNYRAYFDGLNLLFLNGIFFGPAH